MSAGRAARSAETPAGKGHDQGTGEYPRFSDAEMAARRTALERAMERRGVQHAILYGANRFGSAVPWLTRWPVTREALSVFTPGERDLLLVHFYNHVPNATRIATDADVRWAGPRAIETAVAELHERGGGGDSVGVIGPLPHDAYVDLVDAGFAPVAMGADYVRLRLVKSHEELAWLRIGCEFTDRAVEALSDGLRPGLSEHQLAELCERSYLADGGRAHIHYFGVGPMAMPQISVPAQWPSNRHVTAGDAVSCEISASYWDYAGQVLRTFAVATDPTRQFADLHAVADAAFDAIAERVQAGSSARELIEAAAVIEDAGYTTRDDLVHGFVGGYLPPVLGSLSRQLEAVPDLELEAGMTLVVQPNVITRDETAGVQTGELLLVTDSGPERLHRVERGLRRID